jgi:hypothetical protein
VAATSLGTRRSFGQTEHYGSPVYLSLLFQLSIWTDHSNNSTIYSLELMALAVSLLDISEMRVATLTLLLLVVLSLTGEAAAQTDSLQSRSETIRGKVVSVQSHLPIPRARVAIEGTKLGAIASEEGEYRIAKVPVGHYTLRASSTGYTQATQEVVVRSAHQVVLDFELAEKAVQGDTLTVVGSEALATINRIAVVSATPFSVEDVNRYAAAFQDPSRMAENFAGVFGRGTSNNYIVVRGGSPSELLWRLDGIDIPNPNHFGKSGSSGGLISAINSATLGNSDFFTGAFPAEYGTRLSAVFDLHTRNGNTERPEGRAEISLNGLEALGEAPLPGIAGGSVLVGYRHSTLSVLRQIGLLNYEKLPNFDDASMKLHVPIGSYDEINGTGLWGTAALDIKNSTDQELGAGSGILVGGLDWQHIFSSEVISHLRINHVENRFDEGLGDGTERTKIAYNTAKAELTFTPSLVHSFEIGATAQHAIFDLSQSGARVFDTSQHANFYMAYLNWNWHVLPQLTLNSGIYSQFISLDTGSSYEPRVSLEWAPSEEHAFAIAFGVHRQPEPIEFTQALHYVAGYTYRPEPDLMLKAEAYLKDYSHVPVHRYSLDSYSYLNEGFAQRRDNASTISTGVGRAYGAEFTLLKHYASGYYVTATASLVRQEFAGSDNIWHFGSFDNRYILNLVSGYDIALSTSSTLTLSEKFTVAGGGMYTPIDLVASQTIGREVADSSNAYGARNPAYVRLDVNAEFRFNWSASALTLYVSILNALNIKNITSRYYEETFDPIRGGVIGSIHEDSDLPILPIVGIRFEF